MELSEIAELTVKERLQTIENVSGVDIWGQKRYSMRLWLDPIKMAGYGVTPMDVKNAVDNENVELPSGSIEGNTISLSIRTLGLMHTAKEFNDLIIKEDNNNIVRFSDVGRAEVAPEDLRSLLKKNGEPMVMTVIIPQPGANHIEIADEAYKRIEQLQKDLPEDVTIEMMYDNTRFIRASIGEVQQTIYEAFLLVVLIIFLFLRDWRVTLVPVVVIPVSLVGAFFVMYISGFSVNVLTMLAVVLSVGLVVDDAIVVAERDLLRRGIYHDHPDLRILADRVYGRYDGALIQGVQYRDRRFGRYLLVRGPYVYTDVGYQAIEEEREEKLVLSEDRAVLRGIEHDLRQVVERVLEP